MIKLKGPGVNSKVLRSDGARALGGAAIHATDSSRRAREAPGPGGALGARPCARHGHGAATVTVTAIAERALLPGASEKNLGSGAAICTSIAASRAAAARAG